MIKSELIERIASRNPHLFQRDVEHIVNAILEEMVAALARLAGFEIGNAGAALIPRRLMVDGLLSVWQGPVSGRSDR